MKNKMWELSLDAFHMIPMNMWVNILFIHGLERLRY